MFVSGGFRNEDDESAIFQYSITNNTWRTLPKCPASQQGLATLNGEIISIGGKLPQGAINTVYTFRNGEWMEILPPMLTARYLLSAVSHNNEFIVAAGGLIGTRRDGQAFGVENVEVYIKERQWYATTRLPTPQVTLSACVVNDVCYLLGGVGTEIAMSQTALYISLPSLIDKAAAARGNSTDEKWNMLSTKHPLHFASVVELDGKLFTMGGSHDAVMRCGTRFISTYDSASDTWMEFEDAQLPVPLYRPGVVKLADNKVMVIGGQPKMQEFSNEVYIGSWELLPDYVTTQLC